MGYLKVAMFPGTIGVDVANQISEGVAQLGAAERLIIDLRGNTGGGIGALRVMSMLTPLKIPVGYSPGKKWAGRDLEVLKNSFTRFDSVPATKGSLWLLALRYLPSLVMKAPVVLETEGLGDRPFHGNIVLLVDRHRQRRRDDRGVRKRESTRYHRRREYRWPSLVSYVSEGRAWLPPGSSHRRLPHLARNLSQGDADRARRRD